MRSSFASKMCFRRRAIKVFGACFSGGSLEAGLSVMNRAGLLRSIDTSNCRPRPSRRSISNLKLLSDARDIDRPCTSDAISLTTAERSRLSTNVYYLSGDIEGTKLIRCVLVLKVTHNDGSRDVILPAAAPLVEGRPYDAEHDGCDCDEVPRSACQRSRCSRGFKGSCINDAGICEHHSEGSAAQALREKQVEEGDDCHDGASSDLRLSARETAVCNAYDCQKRRAGRDQRKRVNPEDYRMDEDGGTLVSKEGCAVSLIYFSDLGLEVVNRFNLVEWKNTGRHFTSRRVGHSTDCVTGCAFFFRQL